jgi:hypothetical protein
MIHQAFHLALLQTSNSSPLTWAVEHVSAIGWPALCYFAWKVATYFSKASEQMNKTIGQIDKMSLNCFPTMQASLQNQDNMLHSINENLKTIAQNSYRRREDF